MRRSVRLTVRFALRVALAAVLWWVVAEGEVPAGPVPWLVVTAAAAVSLPLVPSGVALPRARALARFVPYFVAGSLAGGVDVALRAWGPRRRLAPGLVTVPLVLRKGRARIAFAWAVSLLPGTVSAVLGDDTLVVHALDRRIDVRGRLVELERRVGDLFGDEVPVAR